MAGTPSRNPSSAVKIPGAGQFRLQTRPQPFYAALPDRQRSAPMSTPNVQQVPPPPLPPPRWVEDAGDGRDAGWEFENQINGNKTASHSSSMPVKQGSSLLGGFRAVPTRKFGGPQKHVDLNSSGAQPSPVSSGYRSDESDFASKDTRIPDLRELLEYNKLQSEHQMGQQTLERSSQAYDKHLLSRIGGSRMPTMRPGETPATGSVSEDTEMCSQTAPPKPKGPLRPLAMPERRHSDMDARSPRALWNSSGGSGGGEGAPPSSVASPHFSGLRSPMSERGLERNTSQPPRTDLLKSEDSGSVSNRHMHRDGFEQINTIEQEHGVRSPAMQQGYERSPAGSDDRPQSSRTGQKRRAQSPPIDSLPDARVPDGTHHNNPESWQRRPPQTVAGRIMQQPGRFQAPSSHSTTGSSVPQNASYASSFSLSNPSTSTQYSSERSSPNNSYQTADTIGPTSPHPPFAVNSPDRMDASKAPPIPHRRPATSSLARGPGLWICDCCPKKPKKFESEDELRIHEMEKQYICQYCHNRFKNKNEAERHQNSLHLRRHSWSCAALTSFEAAFHPTPSNSVMSIQSPNYNQNSPLSTNSAHNHGAYPGSLHSTPSDTCGYCGLEFANPPNWDDRVEHLNHVHKFGECNQSKKFFRADHFRQHLKHSHAGTSGKWTNMLENACMKDEPPPQPLGQPQLPPGMPGITMVGQQQLLAAAAAAAAADVGQGVMSGYGSPSALSQSGMGSPLNNSMSLNGQLGLGLMSLDQPAGQQALMNATGPMSGGGPPAPMASMLGHVRQPPQHAPHQPYQQPGQGGGQSLSHD